MKQFPQRLGKVLTQHRRFSSSQLLVPLLILLVGIVWGASSDSMPRKIRERLWDEGRYVQDSRTSPRLLLIYPEPNTRLRHDEELTRYAGRVEPMDARVYLDGEPIQVHPGGVFTGLLKIRSSSRSVRFTARTPGGETSVQRSIRRSPKPPELTHRPLRITSIQPGEGSSFLLLSGSSFRVTVKASPGNIMRARIGSSGRWFSLPEMNAGAYSGSLLVDESVSVNVPQTVQVQLRPAGRGGTPEPILRTTSIDVRRLGSRERISGLVEKDFSTFLKASEGWDRWGNWITGTPFPIVEQYGDRFRVDFGRGAKGFIEVDGASASTSFDAGSLPELGKPEVRFFGSPDVNRVAIDWDTSSPVAHVFQMRGGSGGRELRVELTGAAGSESGAYRAVGDRIGGISKVEVHDATASRPPEVRVSLRPGELWGYGFSMPDPTTLRLEVRTRPRLGQNPSSPLGGMKIVVDAGHGGTDLGALGPSGLTEADVNLVLSALLGDQLESLGAEVYQLRTQHDYLSLDDRVARALEFSPDLFISVHHNSVGFSTHPMKDRGPKVFYHYPHAIPVATRVAARLNEILEPGKAPVVLRNVFRVNRNISPCPSILIEGGFVCNPHDEVRLRDQQTLSRMAGAIARGVADVVAGGRAS